MNRKIFFTVTIIIVALLCLVGLMTVKWISCEPVDAVVVSVENDYRDNTGNPQSSQVTHITYEYEVNGEKYQGKQDAIFWNSLKEGDQKKIRVNPKSHKMFNATMMKGLVGLLIFLTIFDGLLYAILRKEGR